MTFTNSINGFDGAQELLIKLVEQSPDDWATRKRVVQVLYDAEFYREASKLVWSAPEVPPVTEEVVFTTRVVAKGQPERAVRLISKMIEGNQDDPAENLNIAKSLMKEGLVLQALRFYGAATVGDKKLVDADFELELVNADCGDDHWRDLTEADDFPWDGPQDMSISDLTESDGEASAAEVLLNSVTQRVPLKAPVKKTATTSEQEAGAEDAVVLPTSPAREPKPMLSPAAEALVSQQAQKSSGDAADAQLNEDESFSSLVNFFKHKEMEQGQELPSPPKKSQPLATAATSVDLSADTGTEKPPAPPAPSSALIETIQPRPSTTLKEVVPEVVVAEDPKPTPEQAVPSQSIPSQPVQQQAIPSQVITKPVALTEPVTEPIVEPVALTQPVTEVVHQAEQNTVVNEPFSASSFTVQENAPEATKLQPDLNDVTDNEPVISAAIEPVSAPLEESFQSGAEEAPIQSPPEQVQEENVDLSDQVANALAEREVITNEPKKRGFFAALANLFKRSKPKTQQPREVMAASAEIPSQPAVVENVAPQPESMAAEQPAVTSTSEPNADAKTVNTAVATTVLRKPEQEAHQPPRELDGRTQLVALAPEDGSVFFDELSAKYNNFGAGQLPPAAMVARDMANVDYLQLIREACAKDLTAFSKLLGLHRVMTESDCSAWVEDMDLLRKGYGDAVLATVVSKYSVSECREILGAVYQRPGAQAAI